MLRLFTARRCLALLVAFGGCQPDSNFKLTLLVVDEDRCDQHNPPTNTTTPLNKDYQVRVTFMRPDPQASAKPLQRRYQIVCDHLFKPTGKDTTVEVQVPQSAGSTQPADPVFAVRIDALGSDNKLLYTGQIERLDVSKSGRDTESTVFLRPTPAIGKRGGLSCAATARRYRAFHSATLLPNGQVLLVGGLVAQSGGSDLAALNTDHRAFATGTVEVYDPVTMEFTEVEAGLAPRAFHQAFILSSKGPYKVLLVGGVTAQGSQAAFWLRNEQRSPFIISPIAGATAAEAGVLTFDPARKTASYDKIGEGSYAKVGEIRKLLFPAADRELLSQALLAGGGESYTSPDYVGGAGLPANRGFAREAFAPLLDLQDPPAILTNATLARSRAGHAVARIGNGRYVVLGGTMDGAEADVAKDVAELVTFTAPKTVNVSPLALTLPASSPRPTAWHTLTTVGVTDAELAPPTSALWIGGFPLDNDNAAAMRIASSKPQAQVLQLIEDGSPPRVTALAQPPSPASLVAVGYHDALRLADGSVLVTGGTDGSCSNPFCPQDQLVVVVVASGPSYTIRTPARLAVGRFGHRAVRLLDQTVLITGGITTKTSAPNLTKETEIFNPRIGDPAEDPFDRALTAANPSRPILKNPCKLVER